MQEHSRYEELCALAGVGQISAGELKELQTHLQDCDFCKELRSDFIGINSMWLSQAQRLEPEVYDPQSALRQKILRNLEGAGAQFSAPLHEEIAERPEKMSRFNFVPAMSQQPVWALVAVIVVGMLGFGIGTYTHTSTSLASGQNNVAVVTPTVAAPAVTPVIEKKADDSQLLAAKRSQEELQQKLAASEAERSRIQNEIAALGRQIADLQAARNQDANEIARVKANSQEDKSAAMRAEAQLHNLRDAQSSKDAELVAANYRLRDLENKLDERTSAAERERQLMAVGGELKDVIGARNLHIVDVSDVGPQGVKRPFGRVFYTEGKSLIFYAYDLSSTKGQQTFFAWGQREGDVHSTKALGALHNDDPVQKRWVFKFSDNKVLSQIDSVYVTLEPTAKPGDKPRGKKLMNAFLGTPANHP